ncbi:hypothetical protein [Novosphingobium sp. KCTC 2891]|uniref:hypothetical protein n=1 Tax=Novosphingobium sp. KCTC 2891 TaxID=2989730 RepID=UPI002221D8A4|nr:hypothetical protein [Novosphingobium sp. KCTC 2891]
MALLGRVPCLFGRHLINRRKVRDNGALRIVHCAHCGLALEKEEGGHWRRRHIGPADAMA